MSQCKKKELLRFNSLLKEKYAVGCSVLSGSIVHQFLYSSLGVLYGFVKNS